MKRAANYNGNKGGECNRVERLAHCLRVRFVCPYCEGTLETDANGLPTKRVAIDHVFPQLFGGQKGAENQLACCVSCNSSKKAQLLRDFADKKSDPKIVHRVQLALKRRLPIAKAKGILNPTK
jgi:5-methylcytosine-specific restriction endonuclease McrA